VVETIRLANGVLEDTFALLRECGSGAAECTTYWIGPRADPSISKVVHPDHTATRFSYEVDPAWLTRFFAGHSSAGTRVRVQVHTHPGVAGHSSTDDAFCILPVAGFLSLVIPRFATGSVGFEGSVLAQMQEDGSWMRKDPGTVFSR
jgi:hypothetical protein